MYLLENTNPTTSDQKCWFDVSRARIRSVWGDKEEAISLLEPITESENSSLANEATLVMATVYLDHEMFSEAAALLESSWRHFSGDVKPRIKTRFLRRVVDAYIGLGETEKAFAWASRIYQSCEFSEAKIGGAIALRQMSVALRSKGDYDTALTLASLSLEVLEQNGTAHETAASALQVGNILSDKGDTVAALKSFEQAMEIFMRVGDRKNSRICRQYISNLNQTTKPGPSNNG